MKRAKLLKIAIIILASAFVDSGAFGEEPPVPQTAKPKEFEMPTSKSALQKVLERCDDLQVDLTHLLREFEPTSVNTKGEAEAICTLLKRLSAETTTGESFNSRLHALTSLFQDVDSKAAFDVLAAKGIPELCRLFDRLADSKDEKTANDILFVLKILAMYRTEAGTDRVISAARKPLKPESYMWHVILRSTRTSIRTRRSYSSNWAILCHRVSWQWRYWTVPTAWPLQGQKSSTHSTRRKGSRGCNRGYRARTRRCIVTHTVQRRHSLSSTETNALGCLHWRSTILAWMYNWKELGPRQSWVAKRA